ncbi:MAG: glutamate ligase domain-containing protein, partial [Desulfovibrionaceae bacterium]
HECGVELAVMEAGLGGRFDAIRVFAPELVLFTPMGMDHARILGPTLADIARDKAQALAPGGLGLTGFQPPEALAELEARADEAGAELRRVEISGDLPPVGLPGPHQRGNAALARAAWRELAVRHGWAVRPEAEAAALARAFIPGRFQRIDDHAPRLILDGAHNPPALTVLRDALAAAGVVPAALIFACMADKDLDAMLPLVAGLTPGPVFCPDIPGCARLLRPEVLAARLGPRARPVADLPSALAAARAESGDSGPDGAPVLVCGSLYLAAEFYRLHPRLLGRFSGADAPQGAR